MQHRTRALRQASQWSLGWFYEHLCAPQGWPIARQMGTPLFCRCNHDPPSCTQAVRNGERDKKDKTKIEKHTGALPKRGFRTSFSFHLD